MRGALKPDGVLAVGEPFLSETPPSGLLESWGVEAEPFRDLHGTVAALDAHGLELSGLIVASADDWDRYESPKWRAAREWAQANPASPIRAELLDRVAADRERYLRWERGCLWWAIFVARPVDAQHTGSV